MHQVQFSGTYALGRKNSSKYTFVYKELLITGSEFPLSGFFLAVVCTVQVILLEIDCAVFYTNLHESFCQFIS